MAGPKIWLDYDQEALDSQYNQRALVPDADDYIAVDVAESARVREKLDCRIDVAYGPSEDERLDVFPAAAPGSPLAVYMHGGAWTRSDKANESFMAEAFVEAGAAFVAANFGLCPKVTLDEMIRQARDAVAWSHENAASFNADPARLYIAGHSSGGHVGGMMVVTDWPATHGLPRDLVKGALLCSGMYDLAPVRLSARNDYLRLDEAAEDRNSAIRRIPDEGCPLVIGYGGGEQTEFRRQSREFAAAWREAGLEVREFDMPGVNHFELRRHFNDPEGPILKAALEMMGL
ncbi:MAG: alpha/beta hydrolase [Defluviicoccus sp.]|nr:alpha/beta hydrolase [Defluviicoccus sp.]MDE0386058.1 alpha/beta hydrolase [Defluviicoccus sp.]